MRLNFSGSDEGEIREGIRRVGKVIEEQVALFGTLTGSTAAEAEPRPSPPTPTRRAPACCRCPAAARTAAGRGGQ